MADFAIVFLVTFLVVGGVAVALVFGRSPVYRPDDEKLQSILTRLLEGQLHENEWHFFVEMPILHDAEMELVRKKCQEIQESHSLRSRNSIVRIKEPGLIKIRHILNKLEQSGTRSF